MPQTYQTVTDASPGYFPAGSMYCPTTGKTNTWGPFTYPVPESPIEVSYEPEVYLASKKPPDPSHQRRFPPADGSIYMSSYWANESSTQNFVVQRRRESANWIRPAMWDNGNNCCAGPLLMKTVTRWTENWDFTRLSGTLQTLTSEPYGIDTAKVKRAIAATQSEAFAAADSAVDILTEIAEAKQTLNFVRDSVKGAGDIISRVRDKFPLLWRRGKGKNVVQLRQLGGPFRALANAWLATQYAILPIIYTIRSVNDELEDSRAIYATERSFRTVSSVHQDLPDTQLDRYLFETLTGTATVNTTVKSAYPSGRLQRLLDRSAFNPFSTAWEWIPYSFVVDWFLNVGNVIRSNTSIDLSTTRKACTSVKYDLYRQVYHVDKTQDHTELTVAADPCSPSIQTYVHDLVRDSQDLVVIESQRNYNRFLTERPPALPVIDVRLNWRRYLSGLALTVDPILKLLSGLRHR